MLTLDNRDIMIYIGGMRTRTYRDVDGKLHKYQHRTGPRGSGHVKVLVRIPPEYMAVMELTRDETNGMMSVNEQIRRAVRMYITGGLLGIRGYTG